MKDFTITIPAGGAVMTQWTGTVLSVKTCTLPVSVAFNGGTSQDIKSGSVVTAETPFSYANFINPNAVAVTVYFFIGTVALNFAPDDSSVSQARTYAIGNLGIEDNAAASGGLPACVSGYLQITNAMNFVVSGSNEGHARQKIIFSMNPYGDKPLKVGDINLCSFMTIRTSQNIIFDTDDDFVLSGIGGVASVQIGQIFLA